MSDVLVKVDNVSKRFCRNLKRSLWYGLQDLGSEIVSRRHGGGRGLHQSSSDVQLRPDEFWAVKDVSFELRRGEGLGLIGRNGSGKTTLLKILNGLIKPDAGKIEISGNTAAIIALGAGFNPILTGRENIYVNAGIMGLSHQETASRVEEIIEFSELRDFIDSPVQSYSSGMTVRLGFSVATAMRPDVLILDEVLAVGDAYFRSKCYARIDEIRKDTALIFVSHAMDQVGRLCSKGLLMKRGQSTYKSDVTEAIADYEKQSVDKQPGFLQIRDPIKSLSVNVLTKTVKFSKSVDFIFDVHINNVAEEMSARIIFYDGTGAHCADTGIVPLAIKSEPISSGHIFLYACIESLTLKNGNYSISFNLLNGAGDMLAWSQKQHSIELYGSPNCCHSPCQLRLIQKESLP
jgi:lipopolysaccharide transport system ATP-binding protein